MIHSIYQQLNELLNPEKRIKRLNNNKNLKQLQRNTDDPVFYLNELVNGAKTRSNKLFKTSGRIIPVEITYIDLIELASKQKCKCVKTGKSLEFRFNHKNSASVDRIDSNLGYVHGNIRLVTGRVNIAKNDLTEEEFDELILDLALHSGKVVLV